MGFKFKIGASNCVADALSRCDMDLPFDGSCLALFAHPTPTLVSSICRENSSLPKLKELHQAVSEDRAPVHISVKDELIYFKHHLYIGSESSVGELILSEFHNSTTIGYSGACIVGVFYWKDMRKDIRDFVAACLPCQSTKYVRDKPKASYNHSLISNMVWGVASMMGLYLRLPEPLVSAPSVGRVGTQLQTQC